MASLAPPATVSLMDILRERQAQAQAHGGTYGPAVADTDSMLFWLSRALTEARKTADRKQVHVAASASVDQSTLARFEKGVSWPRNPETFVDAYADDLGISAIDLWEEAIRQWRAFREGGEGDPADIIESLVPLEDPAGSASKRAASDTAKRSAAASRQRPARTQGKQQA